MGFTGSRPPGSRKRRDPLCEIVQPFKHLPIGKTQHPDPERLDITLALPIVLASLEMAVPIDLDGPARRDLCRTAGEIDSP